MRRERARHIRVDSRTLDNRSEDALRTQVNGMPPASGEKSGAHHQVSATVRVAGPAICAPNTPSNQC